MIQESREYFCAVVVFLALVSLTRPLSGACPPDWIRIKAGDPNPFDGFGKGVGISESFAVIGAEWDDENGFDSGAGYIFRLQNGDWGQTQKLLGSDGVSGDEFGSRVAIDGDVLLITGLQHVDDDASGTAAVYAFRNNGASWLEIQELLASDGAFGDGFGSSLGISGDKAIIGAPLVFHEGKWTGAAYVFRLDGVNVQWIEEAKLVGDPPTHPGAGVAFGLNVAIDGDVALIGAIGDDSACPEDPICDSGAAYVFRYDADTESWFEEQKLLASDAALGDNFGLSVAVHDDVALIGAPDHNDHDQYAGSVYVFRFDPETSQWVEQQKLRASDGLPGDQFGRTLAMDGDLAVIGASHADPVGPSSGAAYVFRQNAQGLWVEQCKLVPEPNPWTQFFARRSVAMDGTRVIIGAHGEDQQSGAAYIFELSTNPADLNGDCDVGAFDLALLLASWGPCPKPCEPGDPTQTCPADLNGDCTVGPTDLAMLLGSWG